MRDRGSLLLTRPMVEATSQYSVSDDVLARDLDGEIVLLHAGSGTYFSLSGSAAATWRLLTCGATVAEAGEALSSEFGVAAQRTREDVAAFVVRLLEADLIRPCLHG
jgi:hypothetical protein